TVMSDSDDSGVTHMEISSPFEELSDIRSPGVVGPEYEGLPWMLDDPYEDEVFPTEEQPLPAAASPIAKSLDYVSVSNPEADLEEDDEDNPEEDPVNYHANGGDDSDDEDESSEDDEDDDEVDIEADDDEEEEEHPAPADSAVVALPAADQAPSEEETKSFETDESAATHHHTEHPPLEVARLLAISTPPSSSLSPWSSPLPQIPSPPLPPIPSPTPHVSSPLLVSSPVHVLSPSPPASPILPLGYRAAMIRLRAEAASTSHSLPLPPPIILSHTRPNAPSSGTPPLHLLCTNRREDRPEVTLPPRKRLDIALGPAYEVGESSSAATARPAGGLREDYVFVATMDREIRHDLERDVGYGITNSWDEIIEAMQGTLITGGKAAHRGTKADKETSDSDGRVRETAMIDQGVTTALTARDANRSTNGDDSHNSGKVLEGQNELLVNELALLCGRMFSEESNKIEKYVGGLPDMIYESVVASKPKTMQDAVEIVTELMDKKIYTVAKRQTKSKRKFEDTSRNTQNLQQQNKRQNTGWAYTARTGEKKPYGGSKPLCAKCNYHHDGPCVPKCHKCNKVGHFARDCRSTVNANNAYNQRGTRSGQRPTCFECKAQYHFKRECPKLKNNKNRSNQGGNGNAPAKVYAVGRAGTDPDLNIVTGMFLLNNRYASVLFDSGADRSFMSTAFSS
ncbi:putative reverse transcriptase domain-containing protein, partial [Tanacetum coccineum]